MSPHVVVELEPSFQVKPEEEVELWWNANHHYAKERVRGGWPTVRLLIGSVDGAGWPWTTIEYRTDRAYRWIQVLGTPTCMTLELGGGRNVYRVGRAAQARGARVPMPQECQWWVVAVWDNQIFTADEAYRIARTYLARALLADEWSLEEIFYLRHRLR